MGGLGCLGNLGRSGHPRGTFAAGGRQTFVTRCATLRAIVIAAAIIIDRAERPSPD
jgi:hypothetical protein